jgi:hypothetical protein
LHWHTVFAPSKQAVTCVCVFDCASPVSHVPHEEAHCVDTVFAVSEPGVPADQKPVVLALQAPHSRSAIAVACFLK